MCSGGTSRDGPREQSGLQILGDSLLVDFDADAGLLGDLNEGFLVNTAQKQVSDVAARESLQDFEKLNVSGEQCPSVDRPFGSESGNRTGNAGREQVT